MVIPGQACTATFLCLRMPEGENVARGPKSKSLSVYGYVSEGLILPPSNDFQAL